MEILKSLDGVNVGKKSLAVTIGNFDGVHLGHQALITDILAECKKNGEELVVCTFNPHPKFILNNATNFLINSYDERRFVLESLGVRYLLEFEFTRDFSTQTPAEFLDKHISISSKVSSLYLGHDFAFGANKSGDHAFVKKYCASKNINCFLEKEFIPTSAKKASSTMIRNALASGDVAVANSLLGRPFFVSGRVIKGMGRGKTIGFPTANVLFSQDRILPKVGVYESLTSYNDMTYKSITNIGFNPTFDNNTNVNFETHIFDFDNDIYGEMLKVELHSFIRDEIKFKNANDLIEQISKDIKSIK